MREAGGRRRGRDAERRWCVAGPPTLRDGRPHHVRGAGTVGVPGLAAGREQSTVYAWPVDGGRCGGRHVVDTLPSGSATAAADGT